MLVGSKWMILQLALILVDPCYQRSHQLLLNPSTKQQTTNSHHITA